MINTQETSNLESDWMPNGQCRPYPTEVFFPSDGVGVDRARAICRGCPVLETCLDYAVENRIDHGVWGGASERERRRIYKQRQRSALQISRLSELASIESAEEELSA